jgi:PAS domain S-box-containing protein
VSEATKLAAGGHAPIRWILAHSQALDWWTALSGRHKHLPLAVGLSIFAVAYYLAFKFSVDPTTQVPSPFWFPNSVLLCALLRSRPRYWWLILLITVPIRLIDNVIPPHPLWYRIGSTAVSAVQALAGAWAFRLIAPQLDRFGSWREWLALGAVVTIAAAAALSMAGLRLALGQDYWLSFQFGFAGDALALLVVTPALLTWLFWQGPPAAPAGVRGKIEAAALLIALLAVSHMSFISPSLLTRFPESQYFLPIPLLYWAALRFGMAGASIAVLIVAGFAVHSQPLLQALGRLQQTIDFDTYLGNTPAAVLSQFLLFRTVPVYVVAGLVERRQRAELSRRESEDRFRSMANTAPVLIWMSGTDKLCDFFNQVWLDFTGRPLKAELGNGWAEGVHPADLDHCLQTYVTAFDAHRPFRMEYRLRNRDGDYRWIVDIGVPRFDANNNFCGYIGSAIDITEQRQAQENNAHIGHLQRLAQMGEVTASIAHELRQPLSTIMLHSGTLRTHLPAGGGAQIEEILTSIEQDCQRASNILASVRNQVPRREDQFEPINVNTAVIDCNFLISGEAQRRHVRIVTELANDLPLVNGALTEILQVLLNLVSNAMDAMDDTPSVERCVTLRTAWHGDSVQVSVLDQGHGIKPEDLPLLFDSFFTTRPSGMGLGLSIVRSIVQSHRGRVWAENRTSGGAAFHFTLRVPAHRLPT